MTGGTRASLRRVVDDLGTTLLELVHGDVHHGDDGPAIGGVVIHDPVDEELLPLHALVLGVGLSEPAEIAALVRELGEQKAAGLVVRAPVPDDADLRAAAVDTGVAVFGLTRGASWSQLAAMLRSLLAEDDIGVTEPETLGGLPAGDLFALANAIAALIDAPVTIEDRSSRVLAFSGRQDEADASRVETVLGRQVPERYFRMLTERGFFGELYRSHRPVTMDPLLGDGVSLMRVAIAVRAGDEILGSIWAAVHEPLNAERTEALCDAAKLVALHLLRARAGSDVSRRLRAELLATALEGGAGASQALDRLGLADRPVVVLALTVPETPGTAASELVNARERLGDALAMHLTGVQPRAACALVGDIVYGLIPLTRPDADAEERVTRIATEFLDRVGERLPAAVAVGPVAQDAGGLARSRVVVDRIVRVLRERRGRPRVARLADVHVETLMLELRDIVVARGDQPTGAVARLIAYDAKNNGNLVETLRAYLDELGDVAAASARVYVHPNTFRYRLRRLAEVGQVDLGDPEARFALMVQLRVVVGPPLHRKSTMEGQQP
ncbi:PucR family transcriptional regulator [Kutzneria sp. CA-103260]|uniref:PucR family transcriptional regulator n=1 Tax=Kutzneria sp. CA-103260 TaxID=2802641 RepID=UPI001BA7CE04|nr:helix-turn-helix domain-containing protein [Kutzneria sp. CA-103260]QUQ63977.1 DNA-binding protein [Kutzneria sp. CA-103260]